MLCLMCFIFIFSSLRQIVTSIQDFVSNHPSTRYVIEAQGRITCKFYGFMMVRRSLLSGRHEMK